jgi:type I restriction enzyme M protein
VLFRQEEAEMRQRVIEADAIECVLGLGPNLFYNSPMEACVVICRTAKAKARRGRILLINAVNEVTRERAQSFLTDVHIGRIVAAYRQFKDEAGFARVVTLADVRAKEFNLSIALHVGTVAGNGMAVRETAATYGKAELPAALAVWLESSAKVRTALDAVLRART